MNKRNEQTMMNLIVQIAKNDDRIRVAIMNGSRASPSAKKDYFQDYDIIYIVEDVAPFVDDTQYAKIFGDLLIMQKPDEMDGIWPKKKDKFTYLMLFKDGNRIDLTLIQKNLFLTMHRDSQSILLLDKDNILGEIEPHSDNDYLPKPPTEKEFRDCCNEFLWCTQNVAKGICRKELTYVKFMSEQVVKGQLIKLLTWQAAIDTNFKTTFGSYGKYLEKYIQPETWKNFCRTYVGADYDDMWDALFIMCDLSNKVALKISNHHSFKYDIQEFNNVLGYLKSIKNENTKNTESPCFREVVASEFN